MNTTNTPAGIRDLLASERALARCNCSGYDLENYGHSCRLYAYGYQVFENNWRIAGALIARGPIRPVLEGALAAAVALAAIGETMWLIAGVGRGPGAFAAHAVETWNTPVKGACYRIVGGRGSAAVNRGAEGVCRWIGESTQMYGRHATTTRIGLQLCTCAQPRCGHPLAYAALGQLERIPVLSWVAKLEADRVAAKAERAATAEAKLEVTKATLPQRLGGDRARVKDAVLVVLGEHAGKRGRVFWSGDKGKGLRLGVKECACKSRCSHPVLWVGAREVVATVPHALEVEVVGGVEISAEERLEQVVAACAAVGAEDVAAAWSAWGRALTPVAAYTAVHAPTVKPRSRRSRKAADARQG